MIDTTLYDSLVAQIYAAAADDSVWPGLLNRIRGVFSGSATALMSFAPVAAENRIITDRTDTAAAYLRHWHTRNPLRPPRVVLEPGDVVSDLMMMPRAQLIRTDYFNEFLLPADLPHLMAVKLHRTRHADVVLNIMRGPRQDGFGAPEMDIARRLGGHMLIAGRLATRLPAGGLAGAISRDLLDQLTHGLLLVDPEGKVLHLNAQAAGMLARRDGITLYRSRLRAEPASADAALSRLIGLATLGDADGRRGGSLAIARPSGARPWAAIVAPLTSELPVLAPDRTIVLVSLADPEQTPLPPAARLASLFGLTQRECAVAIGVATGNELKDVAATLGVTLLTARQYMSQVLQKTGTSRQHDMARLLVSLGMGPN